MENYVQNGRKRWFNEIWNNGVWHAIQMLNIEDGLIQTIEATHKYCRVYVLISNLVGNFFKKQ